MAFKQTIRWLAEFRVPADDFEHLHVMQISGPDDFVLIKKRFYEAHANVDAKLEKLERVKSPMDIAAAAARILKDAGGNHRPLQGNEHALTQAEVDRLRAEEGNLGPGGYVAPGDLSYPPSPEQVQKIVAADAAGNVAG